MELVTGRAGVPHITSQQHRQMHQGIWGEEAYILSTGNMLEPEVQSSNKILIKDGALMFQGALFSVKVGTTDEITINNGNQGMKRKDLVVARYTYDQSQNIEKAEWKVIQGTPAESNPVAPSGTSGDIQAGDSVVDCPFMIVNLDGINVTGVDIIPEISPTISDLNGKITTPTALISRVLTFKDVGKRIALNGNLSDYSEIEIRYTFNQYGHYIQSMRMPVKLLDGWSTSPDILNGLFNPYGNGDLIAFKFDDSGIIINTSETTQVNWSIAGIYGWG